MAIVFGDGGFRYIDHDAYEPSAAGDIAPLQTILAENSEEGWPFVKDYLSIHMSRQLEHRLNHPEDEMNNPLYTANFYERYGRTIHDHYATVDQLQLNQRLINHPKYKKTVDSTKPVQLTFIGCGAGRGNTDEHVINKTIYHRPSWLYKTKFVAVEPYPPSTGRNPYLNPFYEQKLDVVAQNPREQAQSNGVFLLGSPRMDILGFSERLRLLTSLNTILKPGGFVAIDEACPAFSMPTESGQNAYKHRESWNSTFHPWMADGFFERTWTDRDGEFGKYFYAEPFEIYYTLMRQAGFKLSLGSYKEIMQMFADPLLQTTATDWDRFMSRSVKPRNLFAQIFYQTHDTHRPYNRYMIFWEKEGDPQAGLLDLISSFEAYEASLRKRLKQ